MSTTGEAQDEQTVQEDELLAALAMYKEQIRDIDELLLADPENDEAKQLKQQLQEALEFTEAARKEAFGTDADGADAEGKPAAEPPPWQSGEAHAIAAATPEQEDPHGTGLADTAAAARAAELRARNKRTAGQGEGGAGGEQEEGRQAAHALASTSGPQERPQPGRTFRNNARMHPNNKYYREEPDFMALAEQHPDLKKYLTMPKHPGGKASFDYTSWEGTRQLTATLLKADFGIEWWLPDGQLVPTLTNRANYVHWINDLLALSSPEPASAGQGEEALRGLDIGCGANLVYCLLGAAIYGWHMVGLDVTDVALEWSQRHIDSNPQLASLLEVRRSTCKLLPEQVEGGRRGKKGKHRQQQEAEEQEAEEDACVGGILTPGFKDSEETFAFSMCNPPFFTSMDEANSNPNTACGGTVTEMVYPGGELAFVMRMLEDSVTLGSRVHWYTTMVGKKVTLKALRKELHARHVTAIRTTEFAQGKTSRWAVAWSFAVDPNLATVPLQRPVITPQAAPVIPKRSLTFQVKAPQVDSRKMLQLVEGAMSAHGATCAVDQALWRVNAVLSHESYARLGAGGPGPAVGAGGPGAGIAARGAQPGAAGLSGAAGPSGAQGGVGGQEGPLQVKRPRGDVGGGGGKAAAGGGALPPGALSIRISLFQHQKGQYELSASVPNSAGLTEATRFTQLMARIKDDLEAMCSS